MVTSGRREAYGKGKKRLMVQSDGSEKLNERTAGGLGSGVNKRNYRQRRSSSSTGYNNRDVFQSGNGNDNEDEDQGHEGDYPRPWNNLSAAHPPSQAGLDMHRNLHLRLHSASTLRLRSYSTHLSRPLSQLRICLVPPGERYQPFLRYTVLSVCFRQAGLIVEGRRGRTVAHRIPWLLLHSRDNGKGSRALKSEQRVEIEIPNYSEPGGGDDPLLDP